MTELFTQRIGQFYRSVRHVPARQLFRRLQLVFFRRLLSSPWGAWFAPTLHDTLPLRDQLPTRKFAKRTSSVVEREDGFVFRNLNREFSLALPVDWRLRNQPHTHLERLSLHYHEFLEGLPPEESARLMLDWIEQNPPQQKGYWLDNWNSYAISIRCVQWMQWLAEHGAACDQAERIILSLAQQINFLTHHLETDICGNHLIKNIRCLLWASQFFRGATAEKWYALGLKHLRQEMGRQFLADGTHYELSPTYHCQVVADLLDCAAMLPKTDRQWLLQQLESAVSAMLNLTHPDGLISLMSDGGLHNAYAPSEIVGVWSELGGRLPTTGRFFRLPHAGYFGWMGNRQWLLVDCGPVCADPLPAHGHSDILSFEWDVDGIRIIVDQGVFQYQAGSERDFDRSARSHNTVTYGERDPCELIGSFRTGRRTRPRVESVEITAERFELQGSHEGFSRPGERLVHRRRFLATQGMLRIEDHVDGMGTGDATARFLFNHACQVIAVNEYLLRIICEQTEIELRSNVNLRLTAATWSPDFGLRIATSRVEARFKVGAPVTWFEFAVMDQ